MGIVLGNCLGIVCGMVQGKKLRNSSGNGSRNGLRIGMGNGFRIGLLIILYKKLTYFTKQNNRCLDLYPVPILVRF